MNRVARNFVKMAPVKTFATATATKGPTIPANVNIPGNLPTPPKFDNVQDERRYKKRF